MTRSFDTAGWLGSLCDHFNANPGLSEITGIAGYERRIQVGNELGIFAAWVRTLTNVDAVLVACAAGEGKPYTHLHAQGKLRDGTPVLVVACMLEDDNALLIANTKVEEGATFSVELLFKIAANEDAAVC